MHLNYIVFVYYVVIAQLPDNMEIFIIVSAVFVGAAGNGWPPKTVCGG